MGKLEVTENDRELKIEYDEPAAGIEGYSSELISLFNGFLTHINLTDFLFQPWPGGQPGEWEYKFGTVDGRIWRQQLNISSPTAYTSNWIGITGFWEVHEFAPHRPLRDFCAFLAETIGVTKIQVEWT